MTQLISRPLSRRDLYLGLAKAGLVFTALGSSSAALFGAEPATCRVVADLEQHPAAVTLDGKTVAWQDLDKELGKLSSRSKTVLEYAVTSDEITLRKFRGFQARILRLSQELGFKYASDVGVQPLKPAQKRS